MSSEIIHCKIFNCCNCPFKNCKFAHILCPKGIDCPDLKCKLGHPKGWTAFDALLKEKFGPPVPDAWPTNHPNQANQFGDC